MEAATELVRHCHGRTSRRARDLSRSAERLARYMLVPNPAESSAPARPVRVLVIDDSTVFLAAVRDVLTSMPDFESVGEATVAKRAWHSPPASTPIWCWLT